MPQLTLNKFLKARETDLMDVMSLHYIIHARKKEQTVIEYQGNIGKPFFSYLKLQKKEPNL